MTLNAVRASLADELTAAGIPATLDPSQGLTTPGAAVLTGDPYVAASNRFGVMVLRYQVFLFVEPSPRFTAEADELIGQALVALVDYDIESISGVDAWTIPQTNRVLLGAQIILTTEVAREEITN